MEFLRRNEEFQKQKRVFAGNKPEEWQMPKEWQASIDPDLLMQFFKFDLDFPDQPVPYDITEFPYPSITPVYFFGEKDCINTPRKKKGSLNVGIEYKEIYSERERIRTLNKSRKQEFRCWSPDKRSWNWSVGWTETPFLSVDFINKEDMTITVKLQLDQSKDQIRRDIDLLLNLLDKESKLYGIDFQRKKKRSIRDSKSIYEKYDLLIEIWDNIEKDKKTIYEIASEKFPEVFRFDIEKLRNALERLESNNSNKMPWDGGDDEPMPIDQESAMRRIRRYYNEAKKMIEYDWRYI